MHDTLLTYQKKLYDQDISFLIIVVEKIDQVLLSRAWFSEHFSFHMHWLKNYVFNKHSQNFFINNIFTCAVLK